MKHEKLAEDAYALQQVLENQDVEAVNRLDQYGVLNALSYEFKFSHRFAQILQNKKDLQ